MTSAGLRGVSRESFTTVADALAQLPPSQLLATDLEHVTALFSDEPSLRRTLADPARSTEGAISLMEELLDSRVSPDAMAIVRELVRQRWTTPIDLVAAAEQLAVDAELALAESEGILSEVEDELFRFGRIVAGNTALAGALGDVTAPPVHRAVLITRLLEGKAHPTTVRLAAFAVGGKARGTLTGLGGRSFQAALEWLVEQTAARRDRHVAYVTSASALTPEQEERLAATLENLHGQPVSLRVAVDPSLVGGVTVRIGDEFYDGSVRRRLADARAAVGGQGL